MKTKLFLLLALLYALKIPAQSDFQKIIESEIVKDEITFNLIGGDLYMSIDNSETPKKMYEKTALQGKSKQIIFNSEFINPLKHQIALNNKLLEDELSKTAEEYATTFTSYVTSITHNNFINLQGAKLRTVQISVTETLPITNPILIELASILEISDPKNDFFDLSNENTEFLRAMSKVKDKKLQGEILKLYEEIFINTYNITSYESITSTFANNKIKIDTINKKLKEIKKSYTDLNKKAEQLSAPLIVKAKVKGLNIVNLIKSKSKEVEKDHAEFLKIKEDLDSKYKAFKELLEKIKNNTYKQNKKTVIDNIVFEKGKRNEVTIYLKSFDYDKKKKSLKEKEEKTFVIDLRKFRTLVPVVSSGVLYTNLSFSTFGTETNDAGETIVSQGEDKDNEVAVGAYLNLYINNGWSSPLFLQVGVGPSKEKPLLFTGFGMNIASRISLSAGAAFTWSPSLDELSIGDIVSGTTAIENDIVYKFTKNPKFYLGLSFNLTK